MFSLTTFLLTSEGSPANGVLSVYDDNHALVSRESSINGVVRSDIPTSGVHIVKVSSESHVFSTCSLDILLDGEGEVTLTALPVPSRTPIGADWCSVVGTLKDVLGNPARLNIGVLLVSGDYQADGSVIYNSGSTVSADANGRLYAQLLRGRTYELTFSEVPNENPYTCTVYVPDKEHVDLYDILYPYPVAGFIDQGFTGTGDYLLTIMLSDGRHLALYRDISNYVHSVEADNAEVELVESDGRAVLQVSGQPGSVVRVKGYRRGNITYGPPDTLRIDGGVFLTLVS